MTRRSTARSATAGSTARRISTTTIPGCSALRRAAREPQIDAAKADGRWDIAYDSHSTMEIPEDFLKALGKNKKALAFFESLNKNNKFSIAYRLQTAKKPETREKRMKQILEMMKNGEKFH